MTDNLVLVFFGGVDKFTWQTMKTLVEVTAVFAECHVTAAVICTFQFVSNALLNQTSAAHRIQSRSLLKYKTMS